MKTYFLALLAAGCVAAPAQASSTATTRIIAIVPPSCSIDVLSRTIDGDRVTMMVRRRCNTAHEVFFSANQDALAGAASLRFNNMLVPMVSGFGEISQPEGYYDTTDRIVIEQPQSSKQALMQAANTINISVEAS